MLKGLSTGTSRTAVNFNGTKEYVIDNTNNKPGEDETALRLELLQNMKISLKKKNIVLQSHKEEDCVSKIGDEVNT